LESILKKMMILRQFVFPPLSNILLRVGRGGRMQTVSKRRFCQNASHFSRPRMDDIDRLTFLFQLLRHAVKEAKSISTYADFYRASILFTICSQAWRPYHYPFFSNKAQEVTRFTKSFPTL
jgi:hypothetical protein